MTARFRFPLQGDPPEVATTLDVEVGDGGATLVVTGGVHQSLRLPTGHRPTHAYSGPEVMISLVAKFLADFALALEEAGHGQIVHPWPFDALGTDAWLVHVRQLTSLDERLSAARASGLAEDKRVREAMLAQAASGEPSAQALREWLDVARTQARRALALLKEDAYERRVQAVLLALAGTEEDAADQPNAELWRIPLEQSDPAGNGPAGNDTEGNDPAGNGPEGNDPEGNAPA